MSIQSVLLMLLVAYALADQLLVPCDPSAEYIIKNYKIVIDPEEPRRGDMVEVAGELDLPTAIDKGSYIHIAVQAEGLPLVTKDIDICSLTKQGIYCPLKNHFEKKFNFDIRTELAQERYSAVIQLIDQNKKELLCLKGSYYLK